MLLRTAQGLQAARIPPRKILRSLRRLKAALPRELPLSGLRITAVGNDIAVRNGGTQWEAESGQLLMDFEVAPVRGAVAFLQHAPASAAPSPRRRRRMVRARRGTRGSRTPMPRPKRPIGGRSNWRRTMPTPG